jgi:hypothetical protein
MRYFISSPVTVNEMEVMLDVGVSNILVSYAVAKGNRLEMFYGCAKFDRTMIDSGAFSAWNSGKTVDIDAYKDFALKLPNTFWFVNLDVIPRTGADSAEIRRCAEAGYENYLYLCRFVKNVMPVYHYGEDLQFLERYLDLAPIIGISPANDTSEPIKRRFIAGCFDRALRIYPGQIPKYHGFGYTSYDGMLKFPFYSVDSTSYRRTKVSRRIYNYQQLYCAGETIIPVIRESIRSRLREEEHITSVWRERGVVFDDARDYAAFDGPIPGLDTDRATGQG